MAESTKKRETKSDESDSDPEPQFQVLKAMPKNEILRLMKGLLFLNKSDKPAAERLKEEDKNRLTVANQEFLDFRRSLNLSVDATRIASKGMTLWEVLLNDSKLTIEYHSSLSMSRQKIAEIMLHRLDTSKTKFRRQHRDLFHGDRLERGFLKLRFILGDSINISFTAAAMKVYGTRSKQFKNPLLMAGVAPADELIKVLSEESYLNLMGYFYRQYCSELSENKEENEALTLHNMNCFMKLFFVYYNTHMRGEDERQFDQQHYASSLDSLLANDDFIDCINEGEIPNKALIPLTSPNGNFELREIEDISRFERNSRVGRKIEVNFLPKIVRYDNGSWIPIKEEKTKREEFSSRQRQLPVVPKRIIQEEEKKDIEKSSKSKGGKKKILTNIPLSLLE